jgi:hypothetical protein
MGTAVLLSSDVCRPFLGFKSVALLWHQSGRVYDSMPWFQLVLWCVLGCSALLQPSYRSVVYRELHPTVLQRVHASYGLSTQRALCMLL